MKRYLFDFDGTLVDSMPSFVGVMLRILDENGIEYSDESIAIAALFKKVKWDPIQHSVTKTIDDIKN